MDGPGVSLACEVAGVSAPASGWTGRRSKLDLIKRSLSGRGRGGSSPGVPLL